ncbi:hypothetical protein AB4Y85_03240 [Microvirga sp. 2YAF29]|uniref:hypothetical protein n=1 Tax=Microvirga sp. 2YAF29 TaxID=3233031 RepID=UPI003F99F7C5
MPRLTRSSRVIGGWFERGETLASRVGLRTLLSATAFLGIGLITGFSIGSAVCLTSTAAGSLTGATGGVDGAAGRVSVTIG